MKRGASGKPGRAPSALSTVEGARPTAYPVKDAGVDWITLTCKPGETQSRFDEMGYALLHTRAELGEKLKPWRFENFEGLKADHMAMGKRDDVTLIRLSAGVAWANWHRAFDLSTNCSRIDLQLTIKDVEDVDRFIMLKHKEAMAHASKMKVPTEVDLRLSNRRGPTLYLGVRESARFGRAYNKARESGLVQYQNCARLELQVNGKAANYAAKSLIARGGRPWDVIPYVSGFFRNRGLSNPTRDEAVHMFHVPRSRGSASSRLRWLQAQVSPALRSLIDHGYGNASIEALGLRELITIDFGGPSLKELEEGD